jgi:integrase
MLTAVSVARRIGSILKMSAFQLYLALGRISWAGLNQIVCALRFFYGVTLGRNEAPERVLYAREPRNLPIVVSTDEVVQFLNAVSNLKARVALTCAYAQV